MKVLVLGLQSSGASLLTLLLAQVPGSLAVLDLWARQRFLGVPFGAPVAPAWETSGDVAVKCVVTTAVPLERHLEAFRPDATVLFVRDPVANARSLQSKPHVAHGGALDAKLGALESHFQARERFDAVIHFEDLITDRAGTIETLQGLGWLAEPVHYDLARTADEVVRATRAASKWCDRGFGRRWGAGHIRDGAIDSTLALPPPDPALRARIRPLCPTLCDAYAERVAPGGFGPAATAQAPEV